MKTNLLHAALACAALVITSTAAIAGVGIPAVPIGLEGDPGSIIAHGTTNTDGSVTFRDLAPGKYIIVIDGKGLAATMDKLHPPVPQKKSDSGVSLSVGGLFGGGGGHSDRDGHGSHGGSGGGVGLGLSVPLGHGDTGPDAPGIIQPVGSIIYELSVPSGDGGIADNALRFELPYCRDGAGQGVRIGFTIPAGAVGPVTVKLGISDQASSGNLTSY